PRSASGVRLRRPPQANGLRRWPHVLLPRRLPSRLSRRCTGAVPGRGAEGGRGGPKSRAVAAPTPPLPTEIGNTGKIQPDIHVRIGANYTFARDFHCWGSRGISRPSRRCSTNRTVSILTLQSGGDSRTPANGARGHSHCSNRCHHFDCHELPFSSCLD